MITLLLLLCIGLAIPGVVIAARVVEMTSWRRQLRAYELRFPGGLDIVSVQQWLANAAASTHPMEWSLFHSPPVAVEITATYTGIRYHLLVPGEGGAKILAGLRAAIPGLRIVEDQAYLAAQRTYHVGAELKLTSYSRPLNNMRLEGASTALISTLQPLDEGEEVSIQWVFTSAGTPPPVHTASPHHEDSWWSAYVAEGTTPIDAEAVQALRAKRRSPLLHVSGRLVVAAASKAAAHGLLGRCYGSFHGLNAMGVWIVRRFLPTSLVIQRFIRRRYPVTVWPLLLNTEEFSGLLGFPVGDVTLPGIAVGSSRQLPPQNSIPVNGAVVAVSNYPSLESRRIALHTKDRLLHTAVVGPTGSGKSWLLANMILQDIAAGHGIFVIDMLKGDFIEDILSRLNDRDAERVVIIDPSKRETPVGLNILAGAHNEAARELVVDNTLNVFKGFWSQYWGPRSDQVLRACLSTLVNTLPADGSRFTLLEIVPLLTSQQFRRFVTNQPGVPDGAREFWQRYDAMSDGERSQTIAPLMNKVDAFTSRTVVRLLLGQSSGLDLRDIYWKRKVVLVNLAKGLHGTETSSLLGALLVAKLWQATLERAQVPAEQRRPIFAYIDEAQDVFRLPIPIPDALAQARGLGVGFTLAYQYFAQLPDTIKAAVLGTVRTQIVFATEYDDAKLLERRFSPLTADDLMGLEIYEVAMRLAVGGRTLSPVTGTTLPLGKPVRDAAELAATVQRRYGQPRDEVEAAIRARIELPTQQQRFGRDMPGGRR